MTDADPCMYPVYMRMFEDACAARDRGEMLPIASPMACSRCNADVFTATQIAIDDAAHRRPLRLKSQLCRLINEGKCAREK